MESLSLFFLQVPAKKVCSELLGDMALDGEQRMNQLSYRQPKHVEKPKHF
jgi:hypothetical protein